MMDELVSRLDQYLDGATSLEEFEVWFYDLAFDVEEGHSGALVDVVHHIEGILAESSSGHWRTFVLKRELDAAIREYRHHPRILHMEESNTRDWLMRAQPLVKIRKAIAV